MSTGQYFEFNPKLLVEVWQQRAQEIHAAQGILNITKYFNCADVWYFRREAERSSGRH